MFKSIRKLGAAAMLGVAAIAISGCATSLPTKVTRYQVMPAPQGQTFFIVPGGGEAQRGGLEFQRYAGLVSQYMTALGYAPAPTQESAAMIVQLGYGVDEGREVIVDDPFFYGRRYDLFYGGGYGWPYYSRFGYYGYRAPFYYGWNDPFWYGGGGIRSYTEYRSRLDLDIRDRRTNLSLFEGKAQARSQTDELGTLVPNLVEAMFTGFPGRNGETVKITIPAKKKA